MRHMFLATALALSFVPVLAQAADQQFYMMTGDTEVSGTRDVEARRPAAAIARSLPLATSAAVSERRGAALNNLCISYALRGEYAAALPYCDQAVNTNGKDIAALVNRGVVRYFTGKPADGIEDFEKAVRLDPRTYQARANLIEARENTQLAANPQ